MNLKFLGFILIAFLLSACAQLTPVQIGDYFQPTIKNAPKGMVNLYIYNPYTHPKDDEPLVYLNGQKIAKLPNTTYTVLQVAPNVYEVGIQSESIFGPSKMKVVKTISLSANKNYYLEYTRDMQTSMSTVLGAHSYDTVTTVSSYVANQNFRLINSYNEASNIGMCRVVTPLVAVIEK